MLNAIAAIYSRRRFRVLDCSEISGLHEQRSGISQGCPLSPYLFIVLMTVALMDARRIANLDAEAAPHIVSNDVVYADDTMLLETGETVLQFMINSIVAMGQSYGLALNWEKTELLKVRHPGSIYTPTGQPFRPRTSMH